jgi:hypothetical protein
MGLLNTTPIRISFEVTARLSHGYQGPNLAYRERPWTCNDHLPRPPHYHTCGVGISAWWHLTIYCKVPAMDVDNHNIPLSAHNRLGGI